MSIENDHLSIFVRRTAFFLLAIIISIFFASNIAFAATSIKYGWIALDSNKKPVLQGSQYTLSSKVTPVAFISNGLTVKAIPANAVVYLGNTKTGTAHALVIGDRILGGYKDAFMTTFTIVKKVDFSKATIPSVPKQTFTGKQITPKVTVKYDNRTLKENTDYTVSYKNNIKLGKATVTIVGKGNYTGKQIRTFDIVKKNLADAKVEGLSKKYWTNGVDKVKPSFTVKYNGKTLSKSSYTFSYKNNIKPGKASITIKGKGEYAGAKTVNFELVNINDGIAEMACLLSYSGPHYYNPSSGEYRGTSAYRAAGGVRSCEKGPHYAFVQSGFRSVFRGGAKQSATHDSPSSWKIIGKYKSSYITNGTLQPGDVLAGNCGGGFHTFIFTGSKIPQDIYKKYLKGTDADVGKPSKKYVFVSAHYGTNAYNTAAMCYCDAKWSLANHYGSNLVIYRLVKPDDSKVRHGKPVVKSSTDRIAKYQKKVAKKLKKK